MLKYLDDILFLIGFAVLVAATWLKFGFVWALYLLGIELIIAGVIFGFGGKAVNKNDHS